MKFAEMKTLDRVFEPEKKDFLDSAAKNNWILYFYHDPEVVAAAIAKNNNKYEIVNEYTE